MKIEHWFLLEDVVDHKNGLVGMLEAAVVDCLLPRTAEWCILGNGQT